MATSYQVIHKAVTGNKRMHIISCSVDAASAVFETGLSNVHGFALGVISMTTAGITMKRNVGSGSTALPGRVCINSAVSGDVFLLTVYGT